MKQCLIYDFAASSLMLLLPLSGFAAINNWTNSSGGVWEDTTSWSLGVLPDNTTTTRFGASGSYTVTIGNSAANTVPSSFTNAALDAPLSGSAAQPTLNFNYTNALNFRVNGTLNIGNATVNWNAPNATLSAQTLSVNHNAGFGGQSVLNILGGTVQPVVGPFFGGVGGSFSTVNIYTGGVFTFTYSDARFANTAGSTVQININGGTFNWNNVGGLGHSAGTTGRVVMTSGTLISSSGAQLGIGSYGFNSSQNGYGQFILSNGTLTANGSVDVGAGPRSRGDFQMYGGQFNANRGFTVGLGSGGPAPVGSATGTVLIAGGQVDYVGVANAFQIGAGSNSFGKVTMTGGTFNINSFTRIVNIGGINNSSGEFNLMGGTFNVNNTPFFNGADNSFVIGAGSNSIGLAHITGGRLTMSGIGPGLIIGSNDFAQSAQLILDGGRVELTLGKLTIGSSGILSNRTGGQLQFIVSDTVLGPSVANRIVDGGTLSYKLYTALNVTGAVAKFSVVSGSGLQLDSSTNVNITGTYLLTNAANNFKMLSLTGAGPRWQSDTLQIASNARLEVSNAANARLAATINNEGTIKVTGSTVTYERPVTVSGRYISDPSTQTFNSNVTVTASGTLEGGAGDVFNFKKSLFIQSANNTGFNLRPSTVTFSSGGEHTNAITGRDLGTNGAGYSDNFAYGTLRLGSASDEICFESGDGAASNALYVGFLDLMNNATLVANLHAPTNINIYYLLSEHESRNTYLGDATYQLTDCDGNLGGMLIAAVPEPSTLLLCLGAAPLLLFRRRKK